MNALLLILICIIAIGAVIFYAFDIINADFSGFKDSADSLATEYPYVFFIMVILAGGIYLVDFIKNRKEVGYRGMLQGLVSISFFILFLYLCYISFIENGKLVF